ncbi:hypothetical protein GOPIP_010_00750 [Gordonia polyisoprenivorans NBRC 16320 = JCM 10675]|nr:Shedu anti-phage system protein SduA domain-containing protein [Gordonia polyisoprenivorans]GAB21608.1 hypothetical protein GOPIP_010_00750 [Gordonia polyisoprenivorans NBRC 16320 = JCM 10675]
MSIEEYKAGLRRWVRNSARPGIIRHEGMELKTRGRSFKSVTMHYFGSDREAPSGRKLEFQEVPAKEMDFGYDFNNPTKTFSLANDEVDVLRKFLNGMFADEGYYVRTDSKDLAKVLAERLQPGDEGESALADLLESIGGDEDLVRAVAKSNQAGHLAGLIDQERRRAALEELEQLARTPWTSEGEFQKLIQDNPWIFGGRYVGVTQRRSLTVLDQLDVPLINTDGSIHIVELKTACLPRLFRMHRNHWIVGNDVHEAVSQAENYLHQLDTHAANIKMTLKLEVQRAFATVVVGHTEHCTAEGLTEEDASLALRIYNSHLSRVRVMTYDQLISNAKNAMTLGISGSGDGV